MTIEEGKAKWDFVKSLSNSGSDLYTLWIELQTGSKFGVIHYPLAYSCLAASVTAGHPPAIRDLADMESMHIDWLDKAKNGSGLFAFNLAQAYLRGDFGLVDLKKADDYLNLAALHGFKQAGKLVAAKTPLKPRSDEAIG